MKLSSSGGSHPPPYPTHNAYDGYGELDEGSAHTSIQLIQGRMEALMSFLDALQFPEVAPAVTPSVSTIVMEKGNG